MFENIKDWLIFGSISGAFLTMAKLFAMVKSKGADEEHTKNRLTNLESAEAKTEVKDEGRFKRIYDKLDALSDNQNRIELGIAELKGDVKAKFASLQTTGCEPVKKIKGE